MQGVDNVLSRGERGVKRLIRRRGRVTAVGQHDWSLVEQAIPEELLAVERLPGPVHERRADGRRGKARGRMHAADNKHAHGRAVTRVSCLR